MLPQKPRSRLAAFDCFQTVPSDLAEASVFGAVMTLVASAVCAILFASHTSAFLNSKPQTHLSVDSNQDNMIRINFDVEVYDIKCDHMTVGVWDSFGTERMNITRNIVKQRLDHKGARKGHPYEEDELAQLEFSEKSFNKEELSELDSDWGSSSDKFKHDDFQAVIEAHEFTMVNFYADWCPHCRAFGPTWDEFENKVNAGPTAYPVLDADGMPTNVHALKINCVDFEDACVAQKVHHFPSIRLYRRGAQDGQWTEVTSRSVEMGDFLKAEVKKHHYHSNVTHHEMFGEGCRISGHVEVARVPGTLHFQAAHSNEKTLNLALTNVSHAVHHLSFGEAPRRAWNELPSEYKRHVNPLDGRSFTVDKFHKAPNHFIKVVHTRFVEANMRSYQQTHQWSVRTLQRKAIPQAKFAYDFSPVEVVVTRGDRRWYDYVTQCFAIVGGAFSTLSIAAGATQMLSAQLVGGGSKGAVI
mmetsp:Transcript_33957/g.95470  ORF Transcript_33957/g.95470 Transcript_33957/m.95470 type:complete len:470 (+) Transcript_33957:163-1572(+)